ncbi:hypothetical protein [Arthrobacter sp. KBS0703]|uniref:hypothetical protein n=1 Tax=Arthrobacter sp. KBS0703 TaxID=1955698 RepID=UPI0021B0FDA9|nr:hypothetical protein [Arthrobacter sp. KBS0703]
MTMRDLSKLSVLGASLLLALASCAPPPASGTAQRSSRAPGTQIAAPARVTPALFTSAAAPAALTPPARATTAAAPARCV